MSVWDLIYGYSAEWTLFELFASRNWPIFTVRKINATVGKIGLDQSKNANIFELQSK